MSAAGEIGIVIADDDSIVREALADLIDGEPSLRIDGVGKDADEAIALVRQHRPQIALVDVKMPGGGGSRAAREIRTSSPGTRVIALSAYEERGVVMEMLRAGAVGYLVKGTPAQEILKAIKQCVRGHSALSSEVTADIIEELVSLLDRSERLSTELQELDRVKTEMIQTLSHELLTPISTIQGIAATVGAGWNQLEPAEMARLAGRVGAAGERLRRLVSNIAAAARLDRGGVDVHTRPTGADDIVNLALEQFGSQDGRVDRITTTCRDGCFVWADLELAVQALAVLVENGLDLSPPDQPLEVAVEAREDAVEFMVLDRGPGVPPELGGRIFQAFTQEDASTTRERQGLGIGLYLAHRIMAAHNGEISHRPREGGGTVFVLSFPAAPSRSSAWAPA